MGIFVSRLVPLDCYALEDAAIFGEVDHGRVRSQNEENATRCPKESADE